MIQERIGHTRPTRPIPIFVSFRQKSVACSGLCQQHQQEGGFNLQEASANICETEKGSNISRRETLMGNRTREEGDVLI